MTETISPTYVPCTHDRIDKIYHIADVHFRNVKRHDEYNEVLNRFYNEVEKRGTENSIIIIAGDLAHSKLETSPELSREISEMLIRCASLTDVVVIPGNHDCSTNNMQRLDVISPIVKYIGNQKIHYFRDNGIYIMKNLLFSHYGIFSNVEDYIPYNKIPSIYKNRTDTHIALYHGPLHKSTTDSNYEVSNVSVKPELFDGFHFGIFGDIHKQQTIRISKTKGNDIPRGWVQDYTDENLIVKEFPIIRYPGSLIQQNHSENILGHGFTVWDANKKTYSHVEIHNDYGFFTADVHDGKLTTDISDIPSKARLRFRCFETEPLEIKRILEDIKKSHNIQEVAYIRGDDARLIDRQTIDKVSFHRLSDYHFQNTLIKDYLAIHKPKTPAKVIKKIFEINKILNSKVLDKDRPLNILWKPKIFKFDNMFSYGKGNVIDFSKINGISGIFGPNASGKSSIFSALCFCLFDKCDRTFKASHVMNESKMSFKCEMNFEIDGVDYFVKREGKRDKKGNVRVEVDFYKMVDGNKVNLNDESRRSTNEVIRSYIGTFDDFVLTSLSPQKNKDSNFADKGQTERKDLITKFLGIDIFESLYQLALEESRDISFRMKSLDYNILSSDLENLTHNLSQNSQRVEQMISVRDDLMQSHNSVLGKIIEKGSQIKKIEGVSENIKDIERKHEAIKQKISTIDVSKWEKQIADCSEKITEYTNQIQLVNEDELVTKIEKLTSERRELNNIQSKIEVLKLDVKNKLEKVKFLDNHEYDPNCKYCMKNAFVQDALQAKNDLLRLKDVVEEVVSKKDSLVIIIDSLKDSETEFRDFNTVKSHISNLREEMHRYQSRMMEEQKRKSLLESELGEYSLKIQKYYESIDIAKENEKLESEIRVLHTEERELSKKLSLANTKISDVQSEIKSLNLRIEETKTKLLSVKELEIENKAYQLYMDSVHRDGVPYDIISKSVPTIEKEVNEILSQIVEFGISLSLDGKNINANLTYSDRVWPIEMGSGMESFISNLAFRIALTNISNLPKTNFLAVDEGFGALDEDTFATIPSLFSFLRNSFDFILIISHIDHVKDFVDTQLEIRKEKGFSFVSLT